MTGTLELVETFAEVARLGSFSAAARALRISAPAVTRLVAELEASLGVQLLVRTTRKVALTAAGKAYLDKARTAAAQLRAAGEFVREENNLLAGKLRVAAPLSFGQRYLASAISRFRVLYDKVDIHLDLDDRFVDILTEGYDMALRISGPPSDTSTIWRKIRPIERTLVASPAYLARAGMLTHPRDLHDHNCLGYANLEGGPGWLLKRGTEEWAMRDVRFCFVCNNGDVLAEMAALGEGIALLPHFIVEQKLARLELAEVLPDWNPPEIWLTAFCPPYRKLPAKVETFTRFIEDVIG